MNRPVHPFFGLTIFAFVFALLSGCANKPDSNTDSNDDSVFTTPKIPNYSGGIAPKGTLEVQAERQIAPYKSLKKMGDNGELLFDPNVGTKYYYVAKGETKLFEPSSTGMWPQMLPNGQVILSFGNNLSSSSFESQEDRSGSSLFNDGSFLMIDVENLPGDKRPTYTLYRKWYGAEPEHTKFGDKPVELKSEIIFRAPNRIGYLEKSDTGVIWVQDHHGSEHRGPDQLIRIENGKQEHIAMPPGYENVARIAQTKDMVVGTFGILGGAKPFRNFLKVGNGWQELPLPAGYVMSFVQTVFYDGTILGYVTSADNTKILNVLWRGDKLAILNDLPVWPKQGKKTLVTLSNRNGLLWVVDSMGPGQFPAGEYLIKVSAKP
jgi:hypothetical protein